MNLVSVVIPAISYDLNLKKCLVSLVSQKNIKLEVWVVLNPPKSRVVQAGWPEWIHFIDSAVGVNCARNQGLRKSNSDFVFFLDSDCELADEHYLQKMYEMILSRPLATGVGGGYAIPSNSNLPSQAYQYIQMTWLREQIQNQDMQASALIGGNMLLRKSKLAGFEFDESIVFGGTERELFTRLQKTNAIFYLDLNLNVIHNSSLNEKQLLAKAKAQSEGEKYIRSKHGDAPKKQWMYLLAPDLNPECSIYVEKYKNFFVRKVHKPVIKSWFYRLSEHLSIVQSRRD